MSLYGMQMSLTLTPSQPRALRKKLIMCSFIMPSVPCTMSMRMRSTMSPNMSPPLHFITSLGSDSSHEGFICAKKAWRVSCVVLPGVFERASGAPS